jgi:hypothetical protein
MKEERSQVNYHSFHLKRPENEEQIKKKKEHNKITAKNQ